MPKIIKHLFKEPTFIGSNFGIATWRVDDSDFFGRKNALAECIFTIGLTQRAKGCNSQTG